MSKTLEFIKKHSLNPGSVVIEELIDDYLDEMQKGLDGKESSLLMVPSYVKTDGEVKRNTPVCVVDAGGTNLRVAKMYFDEKGSSVVEGEISRYFMPGSKGGITAAEFFETLADYMQPYLEGTDIIAISLAYPITITPDLDGIVVKMTKEVMIEGIEGVRLVPEINKVLEKRGIGAKKIVILNDTVATCLAGMAEKLGGEYSTFMGTILGTGNNSCYIENIANIGKIGGGKGGMIINTESGGYGRQPMGDLDKEYDATTENPGYHTCEKMVSGGYLGPLCGFVLQKAAQEGCFSDKMKEINGVQSIDIDKLLRNKSGRIAEFAQTDEDMENALLIAENILKRGARLCALQMAAMAVKAYKKGEGKVCMTVEGSTYYKLFGMKKEVDAVLTEFLTARNITADIIEVDLAVLKGCAIAGLLGC